MVAYSFQRRFCDDVAMWRKRQTIRAKRKRHARPGERIQLYFGMRTKHCRKLIDPDPICFSVEPIRIWIPVANHSCLYAVGALTFQEPDWQVVDGKFAQADGFQDEADFERFWRKAHGDGVFEGVLIEWTGDSTSGTASGRGR